MSNRPEKTASSSEKKASSQYGLPGRILFGITILCLLGFALFVAWQRSRQQRFSLDITSDIRLDLVAILTHKNNMFQTKTWQERLVDILPDVIQDPVLKYYKPPRGAKLMTDVSEQQVLFCFKVKYPDTWNTSDLDVVQRTKINPAVNSSGIKGARLHYGEGWYSQRTPFPGWSTSWSGPDEHGILYEVRARDVPRTVREFTLELIGPLDGPATAMRKVRVENPLYEEFAPIARRDALPTTVSLSGVDVSLTSFVSKAAEIGHSMESRQFPWRKELQETGKFFRALGTPDDPYWCNVVIDISENGQAAPWGVQSLKFYYGADEKEFTTSQRRAEDLSNAARHRDFFQFFPDVGMVQQPIKLEVMLDHKTDFAPDEVATIELDLPTTGGVSRLASVSGFWSGPCDVCIGNGGDWKMRSKYGIRATGPMGALTIAIQGTAKNYEITSATLLASDGRKVDVSERVMDNLRGDDLVTFGFQYDDKRISWKNLPPVDLTEYSTMSLTVASPKSVGPFVFYAQPVEAEILVGE